MSDDRWKPNWHKCPKGSMGGAIVLWFHKGIYPGFAIGGLLSDKLSLVMTHGGPEFLKNMPDYYWFIWEELPWTCWGSQAKFEAWCEARFDDPLSEVELENALRIVCPDSEHSPQWVLHVEYHGHVDKTLEVMLEASLGEPHARKGYDGLMVVLSWFFMNEEKSVEAKREAQDQLERTGACFSLHTGKASGMA